MAPTPWNTDYRLDIYYSYAGLDHVFQIPVEADPAGDSYQINMKTISSADVGDVADDFIARAKTLFAATTTFTGFKLYRHVSGTIFDAVFDDSRSVAGTHAGSNYSCGQITVTLRDIARKLVKLVILEGAYTPFLHLAYPTGDTALDAFIASYLPAAVGAISPYEYAWSRGENAIRNVVFVTLSSNRRLRRKRGLV